MSTVPPVVGITYASNELDQFVDWRLMFLGIIEAGGIPFAIDCGVDPALDDVDALVGRVDVLVISGGADIDPALYGGDRTDPSLEGVNPGRDAAEVTAFHTARLRGLPILAIGRGMHLVNAAMGGTQWVDLRRDLPSEVEHRTGTDLTRTAHDIVPERGSLLSTAIGTAAAVSVNSHHHQGVRDVAPALRASARAPDGIIEALELPAERILGVQWHPEILWQSEPHARRLLESFVAAASV